MRQAARPPSTTATPEQPAATSAAAAAAAAALVAAGCSGVAVVEGGLAAWRTALLPTTRENREGSSYVSLLTGYRRKDKPAKAAHGH